MADDQARGGAVRYGKRKLSEEEYARQTASKVNEGRQGTRYGNRKGDGNAAAPAAAVKTGTEQPVVSLAKLREALEKTPKLLDAAIANELSKAATRKGALTLFLETENAKDSPRSAIVTKLEAALESLSTGE